jgi:hypothetical protein
MNTANGAAVDRAPDALEPVTAWRAWFVGRESDDGSPRLHSVIHNCEWPVAKKLEASCLTTRGIVSRPHRAPADGCQCGIYGTARVDGLANYVGHGLGPVPRIQAIGLVRLWGVVREHEHGWRGSRAYPCRLWLPTHDFRDEPIDNWDELALAPTTAFPSRCSTAAVRTRPLHRCVRGRRPAITHPPTTREPSAGSDGSASEIVVGSP